MKHLIAGVVAAFISIVLALGIYANGPHSTEGIWCLPVGLPGASISIWFTPNGYSYVLMAFVNWIFYFSIIEVLLVIKRRLAKRLTA